MKTTTTFRIIRAQQTENLAKKHIKVTTILCNDIVEEKKNVARLSYSTEEKKRAYNNIENKRRVK